MKTKPSVRESDIFNQLQDILNPSTVVDVAIDFKRKIAYAAVAFHTNTGNNYLPDGAIFAVVAPIHKADSFEKSFGYNFIVTSDAMPAESMGLSEIKSYCHCPARILDKLSAPKNEQAAKWRQICRRNFSKAVRLFTTGEQDCPCARPDSLAIH